MWQKNCEAVGDTPCEEQKPVNLRSTSEDAHCKLAARFSAIHCRGTWQMRSFMRREALGTGLKRVARHGSGAYMPSGWQPGAACTSSSWRLVNCVRSSSMAVCRGRGTCCKHRAHVGIVRVCTLGRSCTCMCALEAAAENYKTVAPCKGFPL